MWASCQYQGFQSRRVGLSPGSPAPSCRAHLVLCVCTLSSTIFGMDNPMTSSQVAKLLGLTRQRVDQIVKTDSTFPAPAMVLPSGRVWERADVEKWARETGRIK